MKQGAVPAKDRLYRALFGEEKVKPAVWSSFTKKTLIGYDHDRKSRLIDIKRIPVRLLAELRQTIPVEGEPLGNQDQEAAPKTASKPKQGRIQSGSERISINARNKRRKDDF
jgi:hypothetical protein